MRPYRSIVLSCLVTSSLTIGCSQDSSRPLGDSTDRFTQWDSRPNSAQSNGSKINGSKINGSKINGSKINGGTLQSIENITASNAKLKGILASTGQQISGPDFVVSDHTAVLEDHTEAAVRISAYVPVTPPGLPTIDCYLMTNPSTGDSICGNDDSGTPIPACPMANVYDVNTGMPIPASTAADGGASALTLWTPACRFAALEKCNEYGYPEWGSRLEVASGATRSLAPYHSACVRMVRADYCGDGHAHTYNGTIIDIYDNLGFNNKETSGDGSDGFYLEAEWGVDGAWCINKTRWMQTGPQSLAANNSNANPDWAYIEQHCPWRIAGRPIPVEQGGDGIHARPCGVDSDYNTSVGGSMPDQTKRRLLRNNSKLYQQ